MGNVLIVLVAALVFGGVWWGLTKLQTPLFVVAALSFFFGLLVFVSRTLLGMPL